MQRLGASRKGGPDSGQGNLRTRAQGIRCVMITSIPSQPRTWGSNVAMLATRAYGIEMLEPRLLRAKKGAPPATFPASEPAPPPDGGGMPKVPPLGGLSRWRDPPWKGSFPGPE